MSNYTPEELAKMRNEYRKLNECTCWESDKEAADSINYVPATPEEKAKLENCQFRVQENDEIEEDNMGL